MDDAETLVRIGLALAIGLLFGLERGWHGREHSEGERIAGIRTFALTGLLGGVAAWLASLTAPVVLAAALLGAGVLVAVSYWAQLTEDSDRGLTTEVALLLAFALGAASVLGDMAPAAAVAVVATLLLTMKARLHRWVAQIERLELDAVVKLGLISVVVLPVLPDQGFGPGGALNPYELWWVVVVVAGLSFFGYLGIRIAGAGLGVVLTGALGGLASSTSTTLVLARLVRSRPGLMPVAAAGVVVAGSITFLRVLVLSAIFQPALMAPLAWPMAVMAMTGLTGAALIHLLAGGAAEHGQGAPGLSNPLELSAALLFGGMLAVVLLGVHYLRDWLGTTGVYAAAALAGLTDVDALTVSIARLVGQDLSARDGMLAVFIAVTVNTGVKGAICLVAGTSGLGLRVGGVYAVVIAAGSATLGLVR